MQQYGIPEAKIRAVLEDSFFFKDGPNGGDPATAYFQQLTRRERAALELAERMTDICTCITDEFFDRIRGEFTAIEYVVLVAIIGIMNFRSKFNQAMGIDSMGLCSLDAVMKECEKAKCCY